MAPTLQPTETLMLDVARPETRVRTGTQPRIGWGIVDGILGLVLLPFGIWLFVIEGLVNAATWLFNQASAQRRSS